MEVLRLYKRNVVSFLLASGGWQWFIVGWYLDPDDASTIEEVIADIIQHPRGPALLTVGDFNTNLAAPEGLAQDKEIAAAI